METKEILSSTGETIEYAKIYAEQQMEYFHLETSKRLAKTTSNLVVVAVLAVLALIVVLSFSLAIGLLLGEYWGSYGQAFLFLTVIYSLIPILIYVFRKRIIIDPIMSIVIREMYD